MNSPLIVRVRFFRQLTESRRWSICPTVSVLHDNNCMDLMKLYGKSQVIKERFAPVFFFILHYTQRRTGENHMIVFSSFHPF